MGLKGAGDFIGREGGKRARSVDLREEVAIGRGRKGVPEMVSAFLIDRIETGVPTKNRKEIEGPGKAGDNA